MVMQHAGVCSQDAHCLVGRGSCQSLLAFAILPSRLQTSHHYLDTAKSKPSSTSLYVSNQANPSTKRVNRHFSRTPFKYHTNHRLINTAPSISKLRAYPDEMKCRGTACTVCAAPRSLFRGFLARQSSVISSRSVGTKSHARTKKQKQNAISVRC